MPDSAVDITGYNVFRQDRSSKGGGVAIFVKEHLHSSIVFRKSIPKQFDLLILNIKLTMNSTMTVAGCYRPPSAPSCTLPTLSSLLAPYTKAEFVLMGDLNWDMLKPPAQVLNQWDSLNLSQIIATPTRHDPKNPDKATLIDVILTNNPDRYCTGVFCNDLSDHCFTACIRNGSIMKRPTIITQRRLFKNFNDQAFLHDLAEVSWDRLSLIPDINNAWTFFYDSFIEIINKHAPIKKMRLRNRCSPWFNHDLAEQLRQKNFTWRRARKSKSPVDWLSFRRIRNICTQSIRKAKTDYFQEQFKGCGSNPRKFWKTVKDMEGKTAPSQLPSSLMWDGNIVSDNKRMIDIFNQHFVQMSTPPVSVTPQDPSPNLSPLSSPDLAPAHSFSLQDVSVREVFETLSKLDPKKPPGPDGLDPFFLKAAAPIIAEPITYLCNLSIQSAELPSAWKTASVRPLFKGGDQADPNCYRPISILPCIAKILERLICKQLVRFLNTNNILSDFQSGFRAGHSCETATLKVLNDIISALDSKQYCVAVFIDLAKAFDNVVHKHLLVRLNSIGASNSSLAWFENYLTGRTQFVKSDCIFSQPLPILKGVPQGSILAPVLFSIYINDIVKSAANSSIHLYADDTVLYATGPSHAIALETLQQSFQAVQSGFSALGLSINSSKTKVMWFGRKHDVHDGTILAADGHKLDLVSSYKYLGVWIDSSLSFAEHLSSLQSKVKARLSFLYRNRSSFTATAKRSLVQLTVLPLFDYGDVVYRSACKGALERLNVLYHSAIRFATNAPYRTHHCDLYTLANWPSLETRRNIHWLMMVFKTLLGLTPSYLTLLLHLRPAPTHNTRSAPLILLNAPRAHSSLGRSSFQVAAADSWNQLQKSLQLQTLTSVNSFKQVITKSIKFTCSCPNQSSL